MDLQRFTKDVPNKNRIIMKESALLPRFTQNNLTCRKIEGERILSAVKGLSSTGHFENLFIHGSPGSGKTAMVKWAIHKMEEESRRVVCIYANCWRYSTSMAIYSKIADAYGEPISRSGRPSDEIFDRILELMSESKKPLLLVLDEIEALAKQDNARILHNIARVDEDHVLFGLIGISDNEAFLSKLPQKTREILRFTKIEVQPYSKNELLIILKERAAAALRPGSYEDSLLEEIAEIGTVVRGSGRFALEILWKAARSSEDQGLTYVSNAEIEQAKFDLDINGHGLTREERLILELLKEGPKTSTELYTYFWNRSTRSKRQIRNYLRAMQEKKLIEIELIMEGKRPKYSKIRLRVGS